MFFDDYNSFFIVGINIGIIDFGFYGLFLVWDIFFIMVNYFIVILIIKVIIV